MSKRKAPSRSGSKIEGDKPPILITLIPQCSGKAQFLKCLMNDGFEEIGPESVPQSFEKVPIETVLSQLGHSSSAFCTSEISSASESYTDRNIYGTPVFSRIASLKDTQQGLLTQLFTSCSSFSEIEVALGASVHETHRDIFIKSVKNIFAVSPVMTSSTVDISIPQAITYTLQTSKKLLRDSSRTSENIIVWSPMGCSGEHYAEALSVAVQSKRAVRFIRWGMEIPIVSFEDLIKANLMTFLTTGRYVPVEELFESLNKIEEMMKSDDTDNGCPTHDKLSFAAGYSMDNSGMVKKLAATAVYVPCSPGSVYDSKWKAWFTDSILKSIVGVAEGEGEEEDVVETENKNKIEAEVAVSNGGVVGGVGGVGVIRAVGDKGAAIVKGGVQGGVEEVHSPMVNGAAGVSLNGKATNKSASGSGSVGVPIIVSETVCVPPIAALTAAAGAAVVTQAVSGMPHQSSTSALTIIKSTPLPTPSTSTSSEMPKTMTKTMTEDMSESTQGHIQASAPSPAVDLSSQHTDKSGAINNVTTLPAASGVPNKSESASNIIITTAESSLQINTVKTNNTGNSAKLSKEIVSDKDVQSPLVSLLPTTESVNTTTTAITHINQNGSDNDKNKGVGTGKDKDKDVGNSNGNSNENGNGNDNENENAGSTTIQDQSAKKYCCFSIFGFSL